MSAFQLAVDLHMVDVWLSLDVIGRINVVNHHQAPLVLGISPAI